MNNMPASQKLNGKNIMKATTTKKHGWKMAFQTFQMASRMEKDDGPFVFTGDKVTLSDSILCSWRK